VITNVSRRQDDRLTWKDIEMLPLYAGALILGALIVQGLQHVGPELHGATLKTALVVGVLGLRQWAGLDAGAGD